MARVAALSEVATLVAGQAEEVMGGGEAKAMQEASMAKAVSVVESMEEAVWVMVILEVSVAACEEAVVLTAAEARSPLQVLAATVAAATMAVAAMAAAAQAVAAVAAERAAVEWMAAVLLAAREAPAMMVEPTVEAAVVVVEQMAAA